jgi:hypothetical protein
MSIDVSKQKPFPERMFNGFHVCILTCNMKLVDVALSQKIDINHCALFTLWECFIFTKLVGWNGAFGVPATVCASHNDLFMVVTTKVAKIGWHQHQTPSLLIIVTPVSLQDMIRPNTSAMHA